MYNETIAVFNSWVKECDLITLHNDYDLFIYPNLSYSLNSKFKNNFQIDDSETILYARDTSFLNNRNQGIVITSHSIYFLFDNNKMDEVYFINWSDILEVSYQNENIDFILDTSDEENLLSFNLNNFIKSLKDFDTDTLGEILASTFNDMANTQNTIEETCYDDPQYTKTIEHIENLMEENKFEEALEIALDAINIYNTVSLMLKVAIIYYELGHIEKAIEHLGDTYVKIDPDDVDSRSLILYFRAVYQYNIGLFYPARMNFAIIKDLYTDENTMTESDINEAFDLADSDFGKSFLEYDYSFRKLLMPVKNYTDILSESFIVLRTDRLTSIDFPVGHPIQNQLYIGHPYLPHKYIPFENYELEFIEDKLREFCIISQHLGATEITIEALNSSSNSEDVASNNQIQGHLETKYASISGKYSKYNNSKFLENISKSINLHQKFSPIDEPSLPENLVWYHNEPSWQRIYEQRIKGGLLEHEERIETKNTKVINNSELQTISGELEVFYSLLDIEWSKSIQEMFETHDSAILSVKVKFAPLETLGKGTTLLKTNSKEKTPSLTNNEKEYIETLKLCSSDNDMSDGERRLLNRMRDTLGISESRAIQLEAMFSTPVLSTREQEYYEEYKASLDQNGNITPIARRLLNKFRDTLEISEARAKEIENY